MWNPTPVGQVHPGTWWHERQRIFSSILKFSEPLTSHSPFRKREERGRLCNVTWRIELIFAPLLTCSTISKCTWNSRCHFLVKIDHKIWKLFKGLNVPHGRFHPNKPFLGKDGCKCKWNHYLTQYFCVSICGTILRSTYHLPWLREYEFIQGLCMKMLWDSKNNHFNLVLG